MKKGNYITILKYAAYTIGGLILASLVSIYLFLRPLDRTSDTEIYLKPGISRAEIIDRVTEKADPISSMSFSILAFVFKLEKAPAGYYKVSKNQSTYRFAHNLKHGLETPISFVFNNLRTKEQFAKRSSEQLLVDSASLASKLNNPEFCAQYGFTPQTIPAIFIPNTYELYWKTSAEALIKRMKREYDRFWNEERLNKAQQIGLTPIQVATLASIVEEESAQQRERPRIAGLYLNRIKIGMPLQADPTVKFALQDFSIRRVLKEHLEHNSEYNTYKHAGLPPGPIRIVSIQAIESVLNREKHNYIYMCAKEDFSGSHNFAATYDQHLKNAARYRRALDKRNIK
ncbi:MAG: endolytic transglycosylase MltG [Bacteroidales bacterium]